MKRKIYDKLLQWKQNSAGKTAAMIQGAPCSGKSHIALEFAKKEYANYLLINFAEADRIVKDIFSYELEDVDTFFLKLEILYGIKLHKRKSVIIFDEVHRFPQAHKAIKALVADGRYDFIETGAMLSVRDTLEGEELPAEVERFTLHPLDFEEFLWALGKEDLMKPMRKSFAERRPMGRSLHHKALDLFRQYMIVGGMPQAVEEYVKTGDLKKVDRVKRQILKLYREDIRKYGKRHAGKIRLIFDEIPTQLKNHKQHFKFATLRGGSRYTEYRDALFWLEEALMINCCFNAIGPRFGLEANEDRTMLKCFMADTGLLMSLMYDEKAIEKEEVFKNMLLGNLDVSVPTVLDNVVAQLLVSAGNDVYFYTNIDRVDKANRMEVDFMLAQDREEGPNLLSPIKVKAGPNYKRGPLRKFIAKYPERLQTAYDLHTGDVKMEEGILHLPLYMAMLIQP